MFAQGSAFAPAFAMASAGSRAQGNPQPLQARHHLRRSPLRKLAFIEAFRARGHGFNDVGQVDLLPRRSFR
jgi:hypothetical protein